MNTERETNHGEYWPSPFTITFNVKKVWAWVISFFLMSGICYGQTYQIEYSGIDRSSNLSAKQTLSNLLIRSEELDNVTGYTATNLAVVANTTVAPDGASTADTLTASAGASVKRLAGTSGTNRPLSAGPGTFDRTSAYLKAGTHNFIAIGDNGDDVSRAITINLSTCAIGLNTNNIRSISFSVGNGWCYVETVGTRTDVCGGCKNLAWDLYMVATASSAPNTSLTAAGTETVFVWGVQQNVATTAPADYLATTAAAATFGPTCPRGTSQSFIDPTKCFTVTDNRARFW